MSPPDRAFWKSLQSRSFAAAYCLYGEDDFQKEHAVRQLIAQAVEPATRDFNLDVRSAGAFAGLHAWVDRRGGLAGVPGVLGVTRTMSKYSLSMYLLHHVPEHLGPSKRFGLL